MLRYILFSIFILFASFFYHTTVMRPASIIEYPRGHYDYIVVGAGTAGCVVASRLSEMPNTTVLLIEAGGYFNWLSTLPLAAPLMQKTSVDWAFKTETQFYSSRALHNFQQFWPRGKGLGGSGQLNYLVHSFGAPEDYEDWPPGWSYADLHPYFRQIETIMALPGVLPEGPLVDVFLGMNLTDNVTIEIGQNTIKRGGRWSTYHAYLQKAWNRKNLHILPETLVTKILINDKLHAEGVAVEYNNGMLGRINVKSELILCAGAINTPHLLMLSGIGSYEELQQIRIPIVRNLSQVGKNLFDHLNVPIYVKLQSSVSITQKKLLTISELMKYLIFHNGLLATNGIIGSIRKNDSGIMLFGVGSTDEKLLRDIANIETVAFRSLFPSYDDGGQEGFLFLATCLQPKTRGNITINSYSFMDTPRIEPAYLENSDDISCTQEAIKLALEILATKGMQELGVQVHLPYIEECRHFIQDYLDPEYSECFIRFAGLTGYHPGGTCAMGTGDDAVVDANSRVNGIKKLRIVDASVMPTPVSGTPNSVIIAMAERAADIIRNIQFEK